MKKICFLYIDEPYNIYHSISIALELHNRNDSEVHLVCTKRNHNALVSLLGSKIISAMHVKIVRPFWYATLPHYLEIKLQFRYVIFRQYRRLLSGFDGIVCSLYNDLLLSRFVDRNKTKLIFAGHGVANRAYSYNDDIKEFDFILLAGQHEESIRKDRQQLVEGRYMTAGYVKHEFCNSLKVKSPFSDDNPVVFYNPHWLKEYTSYFDHGLSILQQFADQKDYNLIFAPHSLLTTRNKSIVNKINAYEVYDHIHIDLGSTACHDLSYLKVADVYLGDASSQALEFLLIEPRPCLFIDINGVALSDYEFHTWELGDVILESDEIVFRIGESYNRHELHYKEIQQESLKRLFYQSDKSPSSIAADGITAYLSKANQI